MPVPHDDAEGWKRMSAAAPVYGKVKAKIGSEIDKKNPPHLSNYPYPILVANESWDAGEVYAIVKAMVEHYDDYKSAAKGALGWKLDNQNMQWAMPYHAGAIKFFKEAGKWDAAAQKHQDMLVGRQAVIKKAWESQPHPDLAAIYSEIYEGENPEDREKGFKLLAKMNPKHVETKTMMAEMYLQAEDFPNARRSLGDSYEIMPNVRTLTLIAAIEKGEGADDSVIRKWLTKALSAPRGPQWVCENCSTAHSVWRPTCFNCNALDTLTWMDVPETKAEVALGNERAPFVLDVLNSNDGKADQLDLDVEEDLTESENSKNDNDSSKS